MQYRPTAPELLATIADLLDQELLPALPPELQHKARVAANLARILEREARLERDATERERDLLAELLGHDGHVVDLNTELVAHLRSDSDDSDFERAVWDVLVAVGRDDLAIAKPGHDGWEGT